MEQHQELNEDHRLALQQTANLLADCVNILQLMAPGFPGGFDRIKILIANKISTGMSPLDAVYTITKEISEGIIT